MANSAFYLLEDRRLTSRALLTYADAYVRVVGKEGVWGKILRGEAQGMTASVVCMKTAVDSAHLFCGDIFPPFKSRCNPECVLCV